jgi:hypothetical protein
MIDTPKKPHRSPTQIDLYSKCGEAFKRRYINGEVIPPGIALITGKGVDGAQQINFRQKIESYRDLPISEIMEAAAEEFDTQASGEYSLTAEQMSEGPRVVLGKAKDQTVQLARVYAREQAPDYQPISVQREFRIVMPQSTHDLLGFIDLEDILERVTDFKTAKRRKSQDEVNTSLQLTVYAAAYRSWKGRDPREVRLDTLVKSDTPVRQVIAAGRGRADYQALVNRFNTMQQGVAAGVFVPAMPGSWWCSPRWCGYWSTCPYVNSKPVIVEITLPEKQASGGAAEPDGGQANRDARDVTSAPDATIVGRATGPKTKRRKSYKAQREMLLGRKPNCRWCGKKLTKRTATLEHVVPLSQGGADNESNWDLACKECNNERGDSGLDPKHLPERNNDGVSNANT